MRARVGGYSCNTRFTLFLEGLSQGYWDNSERLKKSRLVNFALVTKVSPDKYKKINLG